MQELRDQLHTVEKSAYNFDFKFNLLIALTGSLTDNISRLINTYILLYVYVLAFNTFMTSYFFKFFGMSRLLGLSAVKNCHRSPKKCPVYLLKNTLA